MRIPSLEELRKRKREQAAKSKMTPITEVRKPVISTSTSTRTANSMAGGGYSPPVNLPEPLREEPVTPPEPPASQPEPTKEPEKAPEPVAQKPVEQEKEGSVLPWVAGGLAALGAGLLTKGRGVKKLPNKGINLIERVAEDTLQKGTAKAIATDAGIGYDSLGISKLPKEAKRYGKNLPVSFKTPYNVESTIIQGGDIAKELPAKNAAKADTPKPKVEKFQEWKANKEVAKKATQDVAKTSKLQQARKNKEGATKDAYLKPDMSVGKEINKQRDIIKDIDAKYKEQGRRQTLKRDDLTMEREKMAKEAGDLKAARDKAREPTWRTTIHGEAKAKADTANIKGKDADQNQANMNLNKQLQTKLKPRYSPEEVKKVTSSLIKGVDDVDSRNKLRDVYQKKVKEFKNTKGFPTISDLAKLSRATRKEVGIAGTAKKVSAVRKSNKSVAQPAPAQPAPAQPAPAQPAPAQPAPAQPAPAQPAPKNLDWQQPSTEVRPADKQVDSLLSRARTSSNARGKQPIDVLTNGLDPSAHVKARSSVREITDRATQEFGEMSPNELTKLKKYVNESIKQGKQPNFDEFARSIL